MISRTLLSRYEQKIFMQGIISDIDSFCMISRLDEESWYSQLSSCTVCLVLSIQAPCRQGLNTILQSLSLTSYLGCCSIDIVKTYDSCIIPVSFSKLP
jgi:hypothetical protein